MTTFSKATKTQLLAVTHCRVPAMAPLKQMFEAALDDVKTSLVRAVDTVHIHRLQGRAETLNDFLEMLERAPQIVERMK